MDSNTLSKWCRICFGDTISGIYLFGQDSDNMMLKGKIKKYLGLKVNADDKYPKMICDDCYKMLDGFHKFATMALHNQERMSRLLNNARDSKEEKMQHSVLHSFLTKDTNEEKLGVKENSSQGDSEVTEVEVRVDPMIFLQYSELNEAEDTPEKKHCQRCSSVDSGNEDFQENASYVASKHTFDQSEESCNKEVPSNVNNSHCKICKNHTSYKEKSTDSFIYEPKGKHKCDICSRIFKTPCNLLRHKEYHGGVQYTCTVCGRVYPTNSTLRAHSITHSDVRPHKCPLCEKTFKRNQDLKFHINQHTGERPYQCPYCPKAFASSGNCFSHRKRMHPMEVERDRDNSGRNFRR